MNFSALYRPFKSKADKEAEERQAELERSLVIGGWHSRFFTPGERIRVYPQIVKMTDTLLKGGRLKI